MSNLHAVPARVHCTKVFVWKRECDSAEVHTRHIPDCGLEALAFAASGGGDRAAITGGGSMFFAMKVGAASGSFRYLRVHICIEVPGRSLNSFVHTLVFRSKVQLDLCPELTVQSTYRQANCQSATPMQRSWLHNKRKQSL